MASKRYALVGKDCVSCGCCLKVCPIGAIKIWKGVVAVVDSQRCVGCGRCAKECPAGVIELMERRAEV